MSFFAAIERACSVVRSGRIADVRRAAERAGGLATAILFRGEKLGDGVFALGSFVEKATRSARRGRLIKRGGRFGTAACSSMGRERLDRRADALTSLQWSNWSKVRSTRRERDQDFLWLDPAAFGEVRAISIDFAVMERTKRGRDRARSVPLVGHRLLGSSLGDRRKERARPTLHTAMSA